MSKTFRKWSPNQGSLFSRDPRELIEEKHLSRVLLKIVSKLDLSRMYSNYRGSVGGQPPYEPRMMLSVLLYGYMRGVYSSRELERACKERLDFIVLTNYEQPDHNSLNRFRTRQSAELKDLFKQVVELCCEAGLVKLKHVAVDGTKLKANASKSKSRSYDDISEQLLEIEEQVDEWFELAEQADSEQSDDDDSDDLDLIPEDIIEKIEKLQKLDKAQSCLEQKAQSEKDTRDAQEACGRKPKSHRAPRTDPDILGKRKHNFTDPDSSLMKTTKGFQQSYNAQACVDSHCGVIVAESLSNRGVDIDELVPLVEQTKLNTKKSLQELSADAGYCSEHNLEQLEKNEPNLKAYIATTSRKGNPRKVAPGSRVERMQKKISKAGKRSRYTLRKHVVEPIFGQIKWNRNFKQLPRRGILAAQAEWSLVCSAFNLLKLAKTF